MRGIGGLGCLAMAIALSAMALGCAKGRTPPTPTAMVAIDDGNGSVAFEFGTENMCEAGNEVTLDGLCNREKPPLTYPTMAVSIPAFKIDAHEVTNLQYQHCQAAGPCSEPGIVNAGAGGGDFQKYYDEKDDRFADYPMINVTWNQANTYCTWIGKRLPTEYEWEAAGRRSLKQDAPTEYPWGNTLEDCANKQVAIGACNGDLAFPQPVGAMVDDQISVGNLVLHGFGGNVSEWVSDKYDEDVTCAAPMETVGCKSGYVECATQADFSKCAASSANERCDACGVYDEQDSKITEQTNAACYGVCLVDEPNSLWVCMRHESVVTAPESKESGSARGFRGGNYLTSDRCQARTTQRLDRSLEQSTSAQWLGFRCAQDL